MALNLSPSDDRQELHGFVSSRDSRASKEAQASVPKAMTVSEQLQVLFDTVRTVEDQTLRLRELLSLPEHPAADGEAVPRSAPLTASQRHRECIQSLIARVQSLSTQVAVITGEVENLL